jgi:pyruvate dehydrogenase E2 component (dihydrolipoamide acetyltransferase)
LAADVLMPVITAEGEEAVVTAWFVDEAGVCAEAQLIAEVQAEKVSAEVLAPAPGYLVDRIAIGVPVDQGAAIARVVDETPASSAAAPGVPLRASPAARRVAGELGVDLATVTGTGPEGRITEGDVRAAAPTGGSLRAVIARAMRMSHAETVPVTLFTTVSLGADLPDRLTARVVRTVATALADHAHLNGRRAGDRFVPAATAHISLAIQTDEGLVAPVVRDAAARSLDEVAASIADLAERARGRRLTAADYEGGTFSVSNLGPHGVEGFTPVINLPQVAILGVGAARRVPVVDDDGAITLGHEMVLSLTFDHTFVDGAPAADFLHQVASSL